MGKRGEGLRRGCLHPGFDSAFIHLVILGAKAIVLAI